MCSLCPLFPRAPPAELVPARPERRAQRLQRRAGQGASQELARERDRLREELETVKHERLMGEAQGVETLRLRNKLLQVYTGKSLIDACKQLSSVCCRRGWRLRKRR